MDTSSDKHPEHRRLISRRNFLKTGTLALGGCLVPKAAFAACEVFLAAQRSLSFYNLHTGESLQTVYWVEGEYIPESLQAINNILRDYRTDEIKPIDTGLLDLLYTLHQKMDSREQWHIFSGYRSPVTNERLRTKKSGVAKKSMHLKGKAVDIQLPGVRLSDLRAQAMALQVGGVGYYPKSGFVHVDVGNVRYW